MILRLLFAPIIALNVLLSCIISIGTINCPFNNGYYRVSLSVKYVIAEKENESGIFYIAPWREFARRENERKGAEFFTRLILLAGSRCFKR